MADSLLDLAGVPGGTPPPENPGVLAALDQMRQRWQSDVNAYNAQGGNGLLQYGPFSPGGYGEQAMQPGMSGYFDVQPGGSIIPKIQDPRAVAADAGVSLGQLAGSLYPGGAFGTVGYNLPKSDRSLGYNRPGETLEDQGGFFRLQDVSALRPGNTGGSPILGAPQIGEQLPSTNNWRLLGMGPGWIMRNGKLINTQAPSAKFGFPAAGASGPQAEGGAMGLQPFVGPGNAMTGANEWSAFYWPGAESFTGHARWPIGNV